VQLIGCSSRTAVQFSSVHSSLVNDVPHTHARTHAHAYTHTFNGPLSGTIRVGRYQKSKDQSDFTEARDGEWQWHQLGDMQVCTSLQTGNYASTPPLSLLQVGCPSCRPTNSVKALKAEDVPRQSRINTCATLLLAIDVQSVSR